MKLRVDIFLAFVAIFASQVEGNLEAVDASISNSGVNSTETSGRRVRRFLGLFNVVQFANNACNTSETGTEGICYTANECTNKGGTAKGSCAMGFGVCCVFVFTCASGRSTGQEIFYFQNDQYPNSETNPTVCLFSIAVSSPSICQIRLDFTEFSLDPGSSVDMPCDRDSLEIIGGGGSSNLGMGKLCGTNTGQHLYIPISSQLSSAMLRLVTDARTNITTGYKYRIKATQIDCSSTSSRSLNLKAPVGCLQYFVDRMGTVSSFNWNPAIPRQYLKNQEYAICFKRSDGDCKVELRRSAAAPAFSTSVGSFYSINAATGFTGGKCGPDNGCGVIDCIKAIQVQTTTQPQTDYLMIMNGYHYSPITPGAAIAMPQTYMIDNVYCGAGLGRDSATVGTNTPNGSDDGTGVVMQGPGPFVVVFRSDNQALLVAPPAGTTTTANKEQNELGFSIDYKISSSCSVLPVTTP